jgi:hypothetical protein
MAARQVKITTDQLEQTRRATQFEAARSVLLLRRMNEFCSSTAPKPITDARV